MTDSDPVTSTIAVSALLLAAGNYTGDTYLVWAAAVALAFGMVSIVIEGVRS